jgi:hypothetical protein
MSPTDGEMSFIQYNNDLSRYNLNPSHIAPNPQRIARRIPAVTAKVRTSSRGLTRYLGSPTSNPQRTNIKIGIRGIINPTPININQNIIFSLHIYGLLCPELATRQAEYPQIKWISK